MLTAEQIKQRRSGIGSSDVGAIVSENPFRTVHDVWLEKVGLADEPPKNLISDPIWLGHEMESVIAKRWELETVGPKLVRNTVTAWHPEHEWALSTIDYHDDRQPFELIVECKWVGQRTAVHWSDKPDGIPSYVYAQCMWQMFVTGRRELEVAVIFGGTAEFRIYRVEYSDRVAKAIFDACSHFWNHCVLGNNPPPPDGTPSARKLLELVYPDNHIELIKAPVEASGYFEARAAADADERKAKLAKEAATQRLIEILGKNKAEGMAGDFGIVTYKANKNGRRSIRCVERKEL